MSFTYFPNDSDDFLDDTEPLPFSKHSIDDMGNFDLFFDENEFDMNEEEMIEDSDKDNDNDEPTPDSKGSSDVIKEFFFDESLPFDDAMQEDDSEDPRLSSVYSLYEQQQEQDGQRHNLEHSPSQQQLHVNQRQASSGDVSKSSSGYSDNLKQEASPNSMIPQGQDINNSIAAVSSSSATTPKTQSPRTRQLQKLAASMKRSERSRHQVMLHLNSLTREQHRVIALAKERCQVTQPNYTEENRASTLTRAESRSSVMAAFFAGSRSTLTNGLEQSRRQVGVYMECMSQNTGIV